VLENQTKKKLRFYSLIALFLAFCLIIPIAATTVLSQPSNQEPTTTPADETTNPSPTPKVNDFETNSSTLNIPQATPNSSNPSTLLTKDEALKIAMPLIEAYASENGRVISSVNATFRANVKDIYGFRTDHPSPFEPIMDPSKISSYPNWQVEAFFEPTADSYAPGHMPSTPQGWVNGYSVLIWADNGQIEGACAQALM
jgi:hypothetical protein